MKCSDFEYDVGGKLLNPKLLFKLVTVAGPAIFKIVRKYGPQLREMHQRNPEMFQRVTGKIGAIANARKSELSPENLGKRVEILREQITYLYASANNSEVAEQTRKWRTELAGIQKSIPLLEAMAQKNRKIEMKLLNERIDKLSAEIIAANIADQVEDAELDDTGKTNDRFFRDDTAY
ncbi:hypothetical protein RQN30_00270 [Arcanobacterium hippocoleae]